MLEAKLLSWNVAIPEFPPKGKPDTISCVTARGAAGLTSGFPAYSSPCPRYRVGAGGGTANWDLSSGAEFPKKSIHPSSNLHLLDGEVGTLFPHLGYLAALAVKVPDREAFVWFPQEVLATNQISWWVGGQYWVSQQRMPEPSLAPTT